MADDFLFEGSLADLDPDLDELLQREDQRQNETIILIPSESMAHDAVREAMSSRFGNIYAEGYPREDSRRQTEAEILEFEKELAHYRRYSDPRYYKGVEYADVLEALTRRRAAELFAANGLTPNDIYVNVQPLSGAPANNAVYTALIRPGDTIMGLNLNDGGHLSHGSPVNRSGQIYNAVSYKVDEESETLDYNAIAAIALESRPHVIVAGYSAYPCIVDWRRFREIADSVGAYLLADISHISGLIAAGVHPSPMGLADVVMTTTHKSLCGPRGAMLLTHRKDLARKLDRAVFPGEQGGPHLNTMAALAIALRLANTPQFTELQQRIVRNASRLAQQLQERGIRVVAGGSENHLVMIDVRSSIEHDGDALTGDMAARVLDLAGIVTNRNTIPGDASAFSASGVRMGTVWISQLGYGGDEIDLLAEAIATLLKGCKPFTYAAMGGKKLLRTKVDRASLQRGREIVRQLTGQQPQPAQSNAVAIGGEVAAEFLNFALSSDVLGLQPGQSQATHIAGSGLDHEATVARDGEEHFTMHFGDPQTASEAATWLRDLSDGFVEFEDGDLYAKLPGAVIVTQIEAESAPPTGSAGSAIAPGKPFFIGHNRHEQTADPLPLFSWTEPEDAPLQRTGLYETHVKMGGRMVPFAGWEMPVWYTSVSEEHAAVRQTAALFDVSHMGVLEVSGPHAAHFLNLVSTNDIDTLEVGMSHYTFLLLPDGSVVDDLLIYRREPERFMLVVNASNNDKDWAWLNAVNDGKVRISEEKPGARLLHPATLRDLRDPQWGDDCRVDLALQGPRSTDILLSLVDDPALAKRIKGLPWAGLTEGNIAGFDVIISRTGYTGERTAYELFIHPDNAPAFWQRLMAAGEPFGLVAAGLAARDSTRTEAGLPLYGHEMEGPMSLSPADAGFGSYIKLWKPFFVGRRAFVERDAERTSAVVRFRMNEKGVRRPELGDPVVDKRGKVVGAVTSCAIDSEGYLLGQAYVPEELTAPGSSLSIYQLGGGTRSLRVPDVVKPGSRLPIPDTATVLTRFPSRK